MGQGGQLPRRERGSLRGQAVSEQCKDCHAFVNRQIDGSHDFGVDLCPRHAMVGELAEALERIAEGDHKYTCDASDGEQYGCNCHVTVASVALDRYRATKEPK
jgi:hypothetical protein